MTHPFVAAMTKAATSRNSWPLLVTCRRLPFPGAFCCATHDDCRAEHWRRCDAYDARLAARVHATRPKVRP